MGGSALGYSLPPRTPLMPVFWGPPETTPCLTHVYGAVMAAAALRWLRVGTVGSESSLFRRGLKVGLKRVWLRVRSTGGSRKSPCRAPSSSESDSSVQMTTLLHHILPLRHHYIMCDYITATSLTNDGWLCLLGVLPLLGRTHGAAASGGSSEERGQGNVRRGEVGQLRASEEGERSVS